MVAYPAYKDSGTIWLGKLPEHWDLKPLRALFNIRNEKNSPVKTDQILSLSIAKGVTLYSDKGRGGNKAKDDLTAYKIAHPNDIVLNSMNVIVGAVGLSKYFGAISPVYYAIYLRQYNHNDINYYAKIFSNHNFQRYLSIYGKGILIKKTDTGKLNTIRMKISLEDLKKIVLPIPPIDEQLKIARYLDWKTAKINKFIKAKKKLITLLKEQKQNVINEAVTRGVNPNVKMKDTRVDWLGEVPEHWEVRKLRFLIKGKLKYGANSSGIEYKANLPRYIRITDFNSNGELDSKNKISLNVDNFEQYLANEGDLLFARSGATVGKVFQCKNLTEPSCYAGYLIKATPNTNLILSDYLYFYTQSLVYTYWKNQILIKATIENISAEKYSQLLVTMPDIHEQNLIIHQIIKETSLIKETILQAEKEIELIQEYQTRLISDVVTGKIDVRSVDIPDFESIEINTDPSEIDIDELIMEDMER